MAEEGTINVRRILRITGIAAAMSLVALVTLGTLLLVSALVQDAWQSLPSFKEESARLEVYEKTPWAETHFREFGSLKTRYAEFIGWRRKPFSGQTITIDEDGYRIAPGQSHDPADAAIHVYGGSTVWGTGSDDASTIPAQLSGLMGAVAFNFGESGYVSHQSLNLLMKNLALGYRPKTVVFYDGVNDVSQKCRSEISFFGTASEDKLKNLASQSATWRLIYAGLGISLSSFVKDPFDCDTDAAKANLIADTLLLDWSAAKSLAESHGARFLGVLQPVSYFGTPAAEYLETKQRLQAQFAVMYPLIRRKLDAAGFRYLDLTGIFDGTAPVYIDFCHVTPQGNSMISARIASALKQM